MTDPARSPGGAADAPARGLTPAQWRERCLAGTGSCSLSVVAPVYDEEDNVEPLYRSVAAALAGLEGWELVFVDDGSTDASPARLRALALRDPRVRVVSFARNCGQTAAICAGIQASRGRLIATIDSDLQNDPADLPAMIERLDGHDAVVGYRRDRKDDLVRRWSSRLANAVRNRLSGDSIRDTGCSLKVFRAEAIRSVPFFEGMHRFLPTLLRFQGFRVVEHPVSHHPRRHGRSKYGVWNRALPALLDLLAVRWMRRRMIALPIGEGGPAREERSAHEMRPPAPAGRKWDARGDERPAAGETARASEPR